ncbi:MAG: RIP metalloprotease RseP [Planctomycetaceae bacterium]|nr:RIP metalloprotease RseP [Planctomycetaceae bacterium]
MDIISILYVALGLGLVIFFHELGHFAVAKWCDVYVERFSIGFGPIIWSFKKGETEYALSIIPFGGYVKMLGQDDIDPSQLSSEEIAQDPRSYSSKTVSQRMAIISAGVIMNVITGMLFFVLAFKMGTETTPPILGGLQVGMPAWKAGLQHGDTITRMNGDEVGAFDDVILGVALSRSEEIVIEGLHPNGETFKISVIADTNGTRKQIGASSVQSTKLIPFNKDDENALPHVVAGTPAANAGFEPQDEIMRIGDVDIESFPQLQDFLARNRSKTLDFYVKREGQGDLAKVTVTPNRFRTLGLWMDIEKIAAIRSGSPADKAGFEVGDKIAQIDGKDVGSVIHALQLPGYFAEQQGKEVTVAVSRASDGGADKLVELKVVPADIPGWIERPNAQNIPLSIPSIGVAYHLTTQVLKVKEGSPAHEAGILPNSRITKMQLVKPDGVEKDNFKEDVIEIKFDSENKNWAAAFWKMQRAPLRDVILTVSNEGEEKDIRLTPVRDSEIAWFSPTRGFHVSSLMATRQAETWPAAFSMGYHQAKKTMLQIYFTLHSLFGGRLSVKEFHGPIGIARVAYEVAKLGWSKLLLFLGFLSINLAILNFLPIPVLDGGHMVFLCWEAVTRKRPSERVLVAATYCGMAFVLGLMVLVLYLDIFVHKFGIN